MNALEKFPESETMIRFADCDPFQHLNNSKYLDYFMNAREDHLIGIYGFNLFDYTRKSGKGWVVSQNQLAYLQPAVMMETVIIQTSLLKMRERDILVEMKMLTKDKSRLKALLWSRFHHIDLATKRGMAHGEELTTFFKPLEVSPEGVSTFEERVASMKTKSPV
jgi:YbgC/YbaW family acyl-CoA thioester hydrolase